MLKGPSTAGICVVLAGLGFSVLSFGQGKPSGRARTNGSPATGRSTSPADPKALKGVYPTSRGVLKAISRTQLLLGMDDEHEMKLRITRKTKIFSQSKQGIQEIKAASLQPGQAVAVETQSALDGSFEAVRVTVESPKQ